MRKIHITSCAIVALCVANLSTVDAADPAQPHVANPGGIEVAEHDPCHVPVQLTEDAERQVGGALYQGPPVGHHMERGKPMPEMAGTHMVHDPQHGRAFFMAPDKMHHLEGLFSDECGFRVFFYNAFTKPIAADRFRAFIKVIPESMDEPEVIRFLSILDDRSVLASTIGDEVTPPFDIELYVTFPVAEDPELFTIKVPALEQTAQAPEGAITIEIRNGKVVGEQVVRVTQGDEVILYWITDEEVSLHLHGYDIEKTVQPGSATTMTFTAHAAGRFPIEAHVHRGDAAEPNLMYLEVFPR